MAEPALKLVPQEDEVTKEVATVEDQAKALKVVDTASYVAAGELWKAIKALRAKVAFTFDDLIKAAHLAHKLAVAKKKMHDDPLDAAERMVKQAMSQYDQEQERIRQEEERKQRLAAEESARKEREKLEAQALKALDKGKEDKAEALMDDGAEDPEGDKKDELKNERKRPIGTPSSQQASGARSQSFSAESLFASLRESALAKQINLAQSSLTVQQQQLNIQQQQLNAINNLDMGLA